MLWVGLCGVAGWKKREGMERRREKKEREKERRERKEWWGSRNGYGERRAEGVERWAVPTVLTKAAQALRP